MDTETTTPTNNDPQNGAENRVTDAAAQAWEATRGKAGDALHSGERYVRDNPGTSVLTIFGLGFLVGVLVGWSAGHEEQDDYATSVRKFSKRWGKKLNLDS